MADVTKRLKCKLAGRTIGRVGECGSISDTSADESQKPTKRIHLDISAPPEVQYTMPLDLKDSRANIDTNQLVSPKLTIDIHDLNVADIREASFSNTHRALPNTSWSVLDDRDDHFFRQTEAKKSCDQSELLEMVIKNVSNAFLGMDSDHFEWNSLSRQIEVPETLKDTRLGSFMVEHVKNGSYLRRVIQVCNDIRILPAAPRSLVSLAAAIEREISLLRMRCLDLNLQNCTSLIEFTRLCLPLAKDTELLAMLVGCNDLNKSGKLKSHPDTIELINRAYMKAQNSKSPMLWRLIQSCIRPWIAQLSFAIGLESIQMERGFDNKMRDDFFPDLFILFPFENAIGEKIGASFLIDSAKVPLFIPHNIAEAVASCYYLLVYIGMKSDHGLDRADLMGNETPSFNLLRHNKSELPLNRLRSVESHEIRHSKSVNNHFDRQDANSVNTELSSLREVLARALPRCHELDKYARNLFYDELFQFITVVTDLLLLGNGKTWSLMCDSIDRVRPNITPNLICELNDIVSSSIENAGVCITRENRLEVTYVPTNAMSTIFGHELIQICREVSSNIIMLQISSQYDRLGLYCSEIGVISTHIWSVFKNTESLRELIKAVNQIRSLK